MVQHHDLHSAQHAFTVYSRLYQPTFEIRARIRFIITQKFVCIYRSTTGAKNTTTILSFVASTRSAWLRIVNTIAPALFIMYRYVGFLAFCGTLAITLAIPFGQLVTVKEGDGSQFELKRLPESGEHRSSCYEMTKKGIIVQFCYPSINVAGVGKCGTSALYVLFSKNPDVMIAHKGKEYCQRQQQPLFDYLSGFPTPEQSNASKFMVNGCIHLDKMYISTQQLLEPNTTNFLIVRDLAERQWAAYNFWCYASIDIECNRTAPYWGWVQPGMHRSPEMFDGLVRSFDNPLARHFLPDDPKAMASYYQDRYHMLTSPRGDKPFMLAKETLESHENLPPPAAPHGGLHARYAR
jgi:hypothetical protein